MKAIAVAVTSVSLVFLPGLLIGAEIRIDWPSELKVSCEAEEPGRTNLVVSISGLEEDKAYDVKLEGFYRGPRYISSRRLRDPSVLYKDVPPGKYQILVKDKSRERILVAERFINIEAPKPQLIAPASVLPDTPIRVSLSNAVGTEVRGWLYLTLVPAYYPLNLIGQRRGNISACDSVDHEFKGLSAGEYELRLFQSLASDDPLLARQSIVVRGESDSKAFPSNFRGSDEQAEMLPQVESANNPLSLPKNSGPHCGSGSIQKFLIPEYACYGWAGVLPYAACAAGSWIGYKPVYFGAACKAHDECYSLAGNKKSVCDKAFLSLLVAICNETLSGSFSEIGATNCNNTASEYYHQVNTRGCRAFMAAQLVAGIEDPKCD